MIRGKIKKDNMAQIQKERFFESTEDFDIIDIKDFIGIFQNKSKEFSNLDKSLRVLDVLSEYITITQNNANFIVQYSNLIQEINDILNYNLLLRNRNQLNKELELSRVKSRSSDIAAKTDLLNKLNSSIEQIKEQLKYFEEDYLRLKNQRDQIQKTIDDYNLQIRDLNKQKKESFNQINKITRGIDEPNQNLKKGEKHDVSMSERIKSLQKEAKDAQFEINQIKKKISASNLKFKDINSKYEKLNIDYQKLKTTLDNDEIRINTLKNELKEKVEEEDDGMFEEYDFSELHSIKPSHEIEQEIANITEELSKLMENMDNAFNKELPNDLSEVIKKAIEIKEQLKNNDEKIIISEETNQIINIIENLRNLEVLMNELESRLNVFLLEINLKCDFRLIISEDNKNFSIQVTYIRLNKKEQVKFESLTTPEKVFFILSLYISIQLCIDSKNIIFSNLFVSSKYNKRGSIYRTIKKIVPLFENKDNLKKYNLIFILSNLEMKEPIENLKIVTIKKPGE